MRVIFLGVLLSLSSCNNRIEDRVTNGKQAALFELRTVNDTLHYLSIPQSSSKDAWELPYPVYSFQTGDVDGDGRVDALVGVIKTTRFDSTMARRLFIFKNHEGSVRPLWLGSRLGRPLVDFRVVQVESTTRIRSLEKERNGRYLVAEYKWRKFGLEFVRYLARNMDDSSAMETFGPKH